MSNSSELRRTRRRAALALAACACMLVFVALWQVGGAQPQPTGSTAAPTLELTLGLYGHTPALAWSPDGGRLAFVNNYRRAPEESGVFVYDTASGEVRRLAETVFRDLVWYDDILAAHCDYPPRGCSDAYLTTDGASVEPPDEVSERTRCDREVDGVRFRTDARTGLWLVTNTHEVQVDDEAAEHSESHGLSAPCQAPGGARVAFVSDAPELRVHRVPSRRDVLAQPSRLVLTPGGDIPLGLEDEALTRHQAACAATGASRCSERRFRRERPGLTVTVAPYLIEAAEVSRAQYARCVEAGACPAVDEASCRVFDGEEWVSDVPLPEPMTRFDVPRTCVTRDEASAYCAFVGRRLPTEAEWQAAAGGEAGRIYAWGDEWDPERAQFLGQTPPQLAPVDSRPEGRTPEGVFHLSGNAYEWVAGAACPYEDWSGGVAGCHAGEEPERGVVRGGSFASDGGGVRTTYRRFNDLDVRVDTHGFRCAADVTNEYLCRRAEAVSGVGGHLTNEPPSRCFFDAEGVWGFFAKSMESPFDGDVWELNARIVRLARSGGWDYEIIELSEWNRGSGSQGYVREHRTVDVEGDGVPELFLAVERWDDHSRRNRGVRWTYELLAAVPDGIAPYFAELPDALRGPIEVLERDSEGRLGWLFSLPPVPLSACISDEPREHRFRLLRRTSPDGRLLPADAESLDYAQRFCARREAVELASDETDLGATRLFLDRIICRRLRGEPAGELLDDARVRCAAVPTGDSCRETPALCRNLDALEAAAQLPLPEDGP